MMIKLITHNDADAVHNIYVILAIRIMCEDYKIIVPRVFIRLL